MKKVLKKAVKRISPRLYFMLKIYRDIKLSDTFFVSSGYMQSIISEKPIDKNGCELPWMNYAVINFLKKRLNKNMYLFEYGSGFSTKFYSNYVKKVVSVEHDMEWFEITVKDKAINSEIIFAEYSKNLRGGNYSKKILEQNNKFHIVVVDGRDRVNCVKNSLKQLTEDGIVILDDSSRQFYEEAFKFMAKNDFKHLTLCGLKPGGRIEDCTTIFYRNNNCLKI